MSTAQTTTSRGSGVGFFGLLFLLFLGLKLGGVITWSWWLIFLPLYAPLAIVLLFFGMALVIAAFATSADRRANARRNLRVVT